MLQSGSDKVREKEDEAGELLTFDTHVKQGGYLIEGGEDPDAALLDVIGEIMSYFK